MTTLVLLDLDRTVIACNSAKLWISREWRLGHISTWQLVQTMGWLALYHWGKADVTTFLRSAASWVSGDRELELIKRTEDFWVESIREEIRPEMVEIIEQHRAQGHTMALLTASSNYLSDLVATELNIPYVLSNRMESQDGILTGRMQEPLCFGADKMYHAEVLGKKLGVDWTEGYFYTDSYSDLPVLETVRHPVVVCPDPRLDREATERGWKILRY